MYTVYMSVGEYNRLEEYQQKELYELYKAEAKGRTSVRDFFVWLGEYEA